MVRNQQRPYRKPQLFTLLLTLALASGCVTTPETLNDLSARLAVLPVINNTNDLDGPVFIRHDLNHMLRAWSYKTRSLEKIDETLRNKLGITLGGQLDFNNPGAGAPSPEEIGELLDVDGLFYITLVDFNQVITGVYNNKTVSAKLQLVNVKTGEVVWQNEAEESRSELYTTTSEAKESFVRTLAETVIQKALRVNPLDAETKAVILKLLNSLPPETAIIKDRGKSYDY